MKIEVVAELAVGYYGIADVLPGKALKLGVELVVDDGVIFEPAYFALGGTHLDEAFAVLDDFEGLAVGDEADAVGDSGDAVVQISLTRGDVDILMQLMMEAGAAGQEDCKCEQPERTGDQASGRWSRSDELHRGAMDGSSDGGAWGTGPQSS